ncbi:DUF4443 domain-containing protein [Candidatus Aenigmatarchaeota archaeon]
MMNIDKRSGYTKVHIIKAMLLMMDAPLGRNKLMKELYINEATARTLLRKLEKNSIVVTTSRGHKLTKKGITLSRKYNTKIKGPYFIKKSNITVSKYNVAFIVKKSSSKIKLGIEQRDKAIKMDADGLTTIIKKSRFIIPSIEHWIIPKYIEKLFSSKCNKGDVVLIGSAKNKETAELAALSAAIELLS